MKKIIICLAVLTLLFSGCKHADNTTPDETRIDLSNQKITVDGKPITNDTTQAVYSANDIVFYLSEQGITYGNGEEADEHDQSEADAHTVVHITKPGRYILSGTLSLGQIAVDLGKDAKTDPNAVVTLVLSNVDITCTVAPAVIFYNVYECSSDDTSTATSDVVTEGAGANVIIADDTENNITGSYVAKIYKSYELSADGKKVVDSKKLHKYDGALYSKMTMNVNGEQNGDGILNIKAENEGLDSELHLTINGGIINITSGNDGINTNEDNVSVTTVNGGTLNIICDGSTGEGDGIDSNGWIVINGGKVFAQACATSGDAGIDSDNGIYINGGKVFASGNMFDHIAGGNQTYAVFSFSARQSGSNTYTLKDSSGSVVGEYSPTNDFSYLVISSEDLLPDDYTLWQGETQLLGSKATDMQGGMPMGDKHEMPGKDKNEPPKTPEGADPLDKHQIDKPQGEIPSMPEGDRPERPDDEHGKLSNGTAPAFPSGDRPDAPSGSSPITPDSITPPDAITDEIPLKGTTSTTFTITKGGNMFVGISSAAA